MMDNPTERPVRVLVLSGDFGDGHKQAALALAEAGGRMERPVRVEVTDFTQQVYPRLHPFMRYAFLKGVEKLPSLYGYFFHKSRYSKSEPTLLKAFLSLGLSRLEALLAERSPDIVVCTFPLAAAAMSLLKRRRALAIPLATVITDHTDHSLWVHPGTVLYVTGSSEAAAGLRARGIGSESIRVTGIPVRPSFRSAVDGMRHRRQSGLRDDLPAVLVMGGGSGLLTVEVRRLLRSRKLCGRVQLIVICGNNEALRRDFVKAARGWPEHQVLIKGYADNIHAWMAAADLLLTKPGGLTTSEAVAVGLPMVLARPIPGQEEDNAAVLVRAGVAIRAQEGRLLEEQLLELLESPDRLGAMRTRALKIRPERSAERALETILALHAVEAAPAAVGGQPAAVARV